MKKIAAVVAAGALALVAGNAACGLLSREPPSYEPQRTPNGVTVQDLVVPLREDLPYLRGGETITVHYDMTLEDGTNVDSSRERGQPLTFTLGDPAAELPAGLQEGIIGMRELGRRKLTVPADLAYGADGVPGLIPPDAVIHFDLELLAVEGGTLPEPEPEHDDGFSGHGD